MITGIHAVIYSRDADADRAFFRDVLGFPSVDAGGGWLIFAAPPSEVACHPGETNGKHELYLMCNDVRAEIARLDEKGIKCSSEISGARSASRSSSNRGLARQHDRSVTAAMFAQIAVACDREGRTRLRLHPAKRS